MILHPEYTLTGCSPPPVNMIYKTKMYKPRVRTALESKCSSLNIKQEDPSKRERGSKSKPLVLQHRRLLKARVNMNRVESVVRGRPIYIFLIFLAHLNAVGQANLVFFF